MVALAVLLMTVVVVKSNSSLRLLALIGLALLPLSMDKELLFPYFCIVKFILQISQKINKTLQDIEI